MRPEHRGVILRLTLPALSPTDRITPLRERILFGSRGRAITQRAARVPTATAIQRRLSDLLRPFRLPDAVRYTW